MSARPRRAARGFTLIELLVAIAVLGILARVAYPSFLQQVGKSRRADARSVLMSCAQALERYNTLRGDYGASADPEASAACVGTTRNGHYRLPSGNMPAAGAQTYLLQAAPAGAQRADACGTYTYGQDGIKGVSGGVLPSTSCW